MSLIRPFRGLRPRPELAARVAAPPYDVLDSDEARVMAKGNPISFLHVNKPEIDLPEDVDIHDDRVYATAAANLKKLRDDGVLVLDAKPSIYVYRQKMGNHVQTGIVACASVDEYQKDLIKKHELTRKDKEDDRTRHVDETACNAGPVFLTYRAVPAIDAIVKDICATAPVYDFVADDGIGHTMWLVTDDSRVGKLVELFGAIPCTYVADGHHRSASGSRVRELRKARNPKHTGKEEYNFFMAVFFPGNQLKILDYNRVVKDLRGMTPAAFKAKLETMFDIVPSKDGKPTKAHQFGLYLEGTWHLMTAKAAIVNDKDPVERLDVSLLQKNVLAPLLGVEDPRTDKRIHFVGGIRGLGELKKLVDTGKYAVAFAMHPTSVDELMAIADAGKIMPPKSTWFEPKLRSGLVVHLLD